MFLENYSDKALARIYNNNVERAIKSFKGTVLFIYIFFFRFYSSFFFLRHCRMAGGMYLIQLVMEKKRTQTRTPPNLVVDVSFLLLTFCLWNIFSGKTQTDSGTLSRRRWTICLSTCRFGHRTRRRSPWVAEGTPVRQSVCKNTYKFCAYRITVAVI